MHGVEILVVIQIEKEKEELREEMTKDVLRRLLLVISSRSCSFSFSICCCIILPNIPQHTVRISVSKECIPNSKLFSLVSGLFGDGKLPRQLHRR